MRCTSRININQNRVRELTEAARISLEQTAEALHTEIVQAQVVPRDTGNLQNEAFFVDKSDSRNGKVSLIHSTPYARRLYFHPEYHFGKEENPDAKGKWLEDWLENGSKAESVHRTFKELYRRNAGV